MTSLLALRARALVPVMTLGVLSCCYGDPPKPTTPPGPPPAKTVQVNAPGAAVDVTAILPEGYVTVVDFWAESCGACKVVGGMLAVGVAQAPLVVIRKIDVGDGFSPVAEAYKIGALPHYHVYDKHKRLRADLVGNQCLESWKIAIALSAED